MGMQANGTVRHLDEHFPNNSGFTALVDRPCRPFAGPALLAPMLLPPVRRMLALAYQTGENRGIESMLDPQDWAHP